MKISLAYSRKTWNTLFMQTKQHIIKNELERFEAYHYGVLVAEVDTVEEALQALAEENKENQDFVEINGLNVDDRGFQ